MEMEWGKVVSTAHLGRMGKRIHATPSIRRIEAAGFEMLIGLLDKIVPALARPEGRHDEQLGPVAVPASERHRAAGRDDVNQAAFSSVSSTRRTWAARSSTLPRTMV